MGVIGRNCLAEGYREEGTFPEENILPEVELVTEVFVREETTSLVYVESSFLSHAEWFDARIKEMEVENASFPMFISAKSLEREKDHIEGFSPEVAWVTRA